MSSGVIALPRPWGKHLKASGSRVLVNLASNEYFKAVKPKLLDVEVITPQFRDLKNGQYKMISFFAKKARGVMARYIIQKGLNEPAGLKRFQGRWLLLQQRALRG